MNFTHAARLSAGLLLLAPAGALAQSPIFFDDFSGTSLGPHWTGLPNPLYAQYSVGNGRLTVDWIETPLGKPGPTSHAAPFGANFAPHAGDFIATVRVGWEPGTHRNITVALSGSSRLIGQMVYYETTGMVSAWSGTGGGSVVSTSAPGPGIHDFQISREGDVVHFALNNQHFGSLPTGAWPVDRIGFNTTFFVGGQVFQPVFFESVMVVPGPGTMVPLVGIAIVLSSRRRR